ncbi:hypothetical protein ABN078_09640 [Providencia huaxiensis]|uniref:Uncharacterized protein n=1 Tax=Providencia rettgeri TaxID=587 RepID=A0AAD2ZK18_PRORE|nr:hypothetical protein [Providencia rettgeri]HEC8323903.1 hypothetical protein [Providencia rettgeri]
MFKKSIIFISLLFPILSFATPILPFPPEPPILSIDLNIAYNGDDDDVWFQVKNGDDDDVWLNIK